MLFFSSGLATLLITPVTQVGFTYKSLQILLEETKRGGEIAISSSGMAAPLVASVSPSASVGFGWILWWAGGCLYKAECSGPVTLVKSYNQSHKFWCMDFCLSALVSVNVLGVGQGFFQSLRRADRINFKWKY